MEKEKSSLDFPNKTPNKKGARPEATRVTKGNVKQRKKSFGERMFALFCPGNPKEIAARVFEETLIPSIKNAVQDTFEESLNSLLYDGGNRRTRRRSSSDRESYSRYYEERSSTRSRSSSSSSGLLKAKPTVDELIFETRADAEEVVSRMTDLIRQYGCASVRDLYGYCGKATDYTKEKWGWYDSLNGYEIRRVREGFLLQLPEPVVIS